MKLQGRVALVTGGSGAWRASVFAGGQGAAGR